MTDPTTPTPAPVLPPPVPETEPPVAATKPSAGKRILAIAVALVVAVGAWFGTQWILGIVAPKTPPAAEQTTGGDATQGEVEEPVSESFTYVSTDYGFSVDFPGEPTENVLSQSVIGMDLELLQVQWVNGLELTMLQAIEFPAEVMQQDTETMLVNSIAGAASSSGATASEETATELGGAPARTATLTFDNGDIAHVLVAIKDNRQIMLMVTGDAPLQPLVESFEFTR